MKGGAREARAPLCCFFCPVFSVAPVVSVPVLCDQVDDINEVHELDPVHQVDHKDELRFCVEVESFCALCGHQPRFYFEFVSFCTLWAPTSCLRRLRVDFGRLRVDLSLPNAIRILKFLIHWFWNSRRSKVIVTYNIIIGNSDVSALERRY